MTSPGGKRILVAGGAGFLGSHLCERLLAEGHAVLCLDNFFSASERNIAHLEKRPGFTVIRHDVTEPVTAVLGGHPPVDEIYDLACPASPIHYQREPVATIRAIALGAANLLEAAVAWSARLLLVSTSEVYGDPQVHPQPETYWGNVNPVGPRACYNEAKRCAEAMCFCYLRQQGLAIKVARVFNAYGPRMRSDDGRVISRFILSALRGEPLTIHGDGQQTRSFCYVDDLIDGLLALQAAPMDVTGPLNLGRAEEISVRALAERIVALTGSGSTLAFETRPPDDPRRRCPDTRLAERALGWQAKTSLDEGLRKTIAYYEEQLAKP